VSVLGGALVLACSALREFEEQKLVSTMAHQSLACTSGQDLINWFFVCDSILQFQATKSSFCGSCGNCSIKWHKDSNQRICLLDTKLIQTHKNLDTQLGLEKIIQVSMYV
jgi:hypothetical protein